MAKKELPPAEEGEAPKKRSKVKLIILLVVLLVVLGGLAGAGYWWFLGREDAPGLPFFSEEVEGGEEEIVEEEIVEEPLVDEEGNPLSVDQRIQRKKEQAKTGGAGSLAPRINIASLPSLTVNLADPPGNRSLTIGLDVEVNDKSAIQKIGSNHARILDGLIFIIAGKNVKELISSEGKVLLKNNIASLLNQVLGKPQVVRVYFTQFRIQ